MVQKESLELYDIPTFEGKYKINKNGEIYSLLTNKFLKPRGKIYSAVILYVNSVSKSYTVHKLMCMTFIDFNYIEKGLVCNHKDGNKHNNVLTNLEVVTKSENVIHAYSMGLNSSNPKRGEDCSKSKLKEAQVVEIFLRFKEGNITKEELASLYGVSKYAIKHIVTRNRWQHITKYLI